MTRDQLRTYAAEWESRNRRKHRGAVMPPTVYDLSPPLAFDCRISSRRRMGIGDQIVLVSAIQAVADFMGGGVPFVYFDPHYPGSADVFGMAEGVMVKGVKGDQPLEAGLNIIPCRGHIFDGPPPLYAEGIGHPAAHVLWSWGHADIGVRFPRPRLTPGPDHVKALDDIAELLGPFVTCNPIEVSRGNHDWTCDEWRGVLADVPESHTLVFGCAPHEVETIQGMMARMDLPHRVEVVTCALPAWKSLIDRAAHHYTGNSSGMWLALASGTPTTLLQTDDPNHVHNQLWNYKPAWKCPNVTIVQNAPRMAENEGRGNVKGTGPTPPAAPPRSGFTLTVPRTRNVKI